MYSSKSLTLLLILTSIVLSYGAELPDNSIQRYLLVVGANNGGVERAMLRYAANDANTFSQVFTDMGGVKAENVIQLREPRLREFKQGLLQLERKLATPQQSGRKEVIVYYSGHADETGLQLGNETFAWKDLRKAVDNLPAEVKITVLDACGSGAITRLKGGVRQPAFLVDASSDMKGYAFLTSSSDNEVAQESDRIGGSYFTQSLVTGMRGAADLNGDKKVTLSEAYQFAFNETLNRTQQTTGGAQHPSRDMKLSGTGDVVMTDLRETSAGLVLHKDLEGRFFIRDEHQNLIAELNKNAGRSLELGMAPGIYTVQMEQKGFYIAENIALSERGRREVVRANFKIAPRQYAQARGNPSTNPVMDSLRISRVHQKSEWDIGIFLSQNHRPWVGHQAAFVASYSSAPMIGNQFSLLTNVSRQEVEGSQVTSGFNFASRLDGVQLSSGFNVAGYIHGMQISAGTNIADTASGLQAGSINFGNQVEGHQFGVMNVENHGTGYGVGVMNVAGYSGKDQFGIMNVAGSTGESQIGVLDVGGKIGLHQVGVLNVAGSTGGHQIGVMNIAGSTEGHQVGVYNIAKTVHSNLIGIHNIAYETDGAVVGIFNIVGRTDKPVIGLLNFVGNGFWNMSLSMSEAKTAMTSLQIGTPYMHTNFHFARELGSNQIRGFGWGFGTQFGMNKTYWLGLNVDEIHLFESNETQVWKQYGNSEAYTQSQLTMVRAEYGYKVFRNFAVFGGISGNFLYLHDHENMDVRPMGDYHGSLESGKSYLWPGAFIGLRFGKL